MNSRETKKLTHDEKLMMALEEDAKRMYQEENAEREAILKNVTRTKTNPPQEILDVLHKAEEMGMELPEVVDAWWSEETIVQVLRNEKRKIGVDKLKKIGILGA